ncbi:hypothetical protein N665_0560s0007 [Sinapis alba]|nr:hypothetical protein N665_0560s0007 [Sinapis alba]
MADLVLPNLLDEIICKIIALAGEESFLHRRYGLVHEPSVLKTCNVSPIPNFFNIEIGIYDKFCDFFLKCVNAGNINAVYLEGLHLASVFGFDDAIDALKQNVPTHRMSTLGVGIFNVCLGNDINASKVFQEFGVNHESLMSDELFDMADVLELRLTKFRVLNLNTYCPTFKFLYDDVIKSPKCNYDNTHDFEGSCKYCMLFWICTNVCRML